MYNNYFLCGIRCIERIVGALIHYALVTIDYLGEGVMNQGPYRISLLICSSTLSVSIQNLTSLLTATKSSFDFIP